VLDSKGLHKPRLRSLYESINGAHKLDVCIQLFVRSFILLSCCQVHSVSSLCFPWRVSAYLWNCVVTLVHGEREREREGNSDKQCAKTKLVCCDYKDRCFGSVLLCFVLNKMQNKNLFYFYFMPLFYWKPGWSVKCRKHKTKSSVLWARMALCACVESINNSTTNSFLHWSMDRT